MDDEHHHAPMRLCQGCVVENLAFRGAMLETLEQALSPFGNRTAESDAELEAMREATAVALVNIAKLWGFRELRGIPALGGLFNVATDGIGNWEVELELPQVEA